MINRARENVIAIKEMARSGRSLVSGTAGANSALLKAGAVESGLSLKTKLNSELSSAGICREHRNRIIMTPHALQNLVMDNSLLDS